MPSYWSNNTTLFIQNAGYYSEDFERESKKFKIYEREEYVMNPPADTNLSKGEERFRHFLYLLENGFWKRHVFQREFHHCALKVLAESIVGADDWAQVGPLLIEEYGWDMSNNSKMLLGVAPRRFGKSIAIAMLMAAGALVVYKLTEAVFATSQRISGNMGEYVKEAINMSGNAHRIVKFGEELILIQGDSPEDFRKINCYPANPKISLSVFFFSLSFVFAL